MRRFFTLESLSPNAPYLCVDVLFFISSLWKDSLVLPFLLVSSFAFPAWKPHFQSPEKREPHVDRWGNSLGWLGLLLLEMVVRRECQSVKSCLSLHPKRESLVSFPSISLISLSAPTFPSTCSLLAVFMFFTLPTTSCHPFFNHPDVKQEKKDDVGDTR